MRRWAAAALLAPALAAAASAAPLRVVATLPDLADLARRVGGERVTVTSLAKGTEDMHAIPMRPSFVPLLNRADALVVLGLTAEHTFLPGLLEVSANPRVQPGAPGWIDTSEGLRPLDVPKTLSRAEGELHPDGNPHHNLDPRNAGNAADAIARGLSRVDPAGADAYRARAEAFKKELAARVESWRKAAAPLKGVKAVSHHRDMVYLADFLGLVIVGEVEPKPGIAPTPRHLQELAARMKAEGVRVLIREIHYPGQTALWLSEQTGARVASVAVMGGAFPDAQDYFGFVDRNIRAILEAAR